MEKFYGVGVNSMSAAFQEIEKGRENVAVLVDDVWHIDVIDFGYISSRILCVKLKFSR